MCERKERKDKSANGGNLCGFGFGSDPTMQLAEKMTGKLAHLELRGSRHPGENSLFIPLFLNLYCDEARNFHVIMQYEVKLGILMQYVVRHL